MKRSMLFLLAAIAALAGCNEDSNPVTPAPLVVEPLAATVLRLVGTAPAYEAFVADIDGDGKEDAANCFDVNIVDAAGNIIGTATDCLSNITPVGDGLALVGTTTFKLTNGSFTARGNTTVQPVTTAGPTPITHTTGAVPVEGENGILSGTGDFDQWRAQVRLAGAVNLSRLDSDGLMTFDCLFAIKPLLTTP